MKEEFYQDWKSDNIGWLKDEFLEEKILDELQKDGLARVDGFVSVIKWVKKAIMKTHNKLEDGEYFESEEFNAYCRQMFKDRN